MEDLPVFSKGCDSSYSWSKKFAHLAHTDTVEEICNKLESFLKSDSNPDGTFLHPVSKQWTHLAFTGGEPMMNQNAIVDIMQEFDRRNNPPKFITIESNGTQAAREKFLSYFSKFTDVSDRELFWSISPKLYLSGETKTDALLPEIVSSYNKISNSGQLKYVSNGTTRSWAEVAEFTQAYRAEGVEWPVWIMPVGADIEGQNKISAKVTEGAVERGYNVAARVHTYIFGNVVGK
jgi:organic radical activating enzyme